MPDIEVTEDQRERLRNVEEALADEVVGKYGIVRTRDAVEYLLDRYEADGGIEAAVVEENVDAAPASAVETDDDAESKENDASDETDASETNDGDDEDAADESEDSGSEKEETDDEDSEDEEDDEEDDEDSEDGDSEDGDSEDDEDDDEDDDPATNGGDMLSAMQSLLDDHDDKWGEGTGDDRYEVELPDGSTESARTKDDVRALLFQHYR